MTRPRLLDELDARAPLTVVRGPGGAGKTVLAAQWTARAGLPGLWIEVTESIATREDLWTAIAKRMTAAGLFPPRAPCAEGRGHRCDLQRGLAARREPVLLVLDGFERTEAPEAVAADLVDLLVACPSLSALVLTRVHTALEGGVTAARLDRVTVGPARLALTAGETGDIAAAAGTGPEHDAAALQRASGGNPRLLRSLLLGVAGPGAQPPSGIGPEAAEAGSAVRGMVADLLARDAARREVLLRTAIPERFDLALAQELTGQVGAETHLETLEAGGLLLRSGRSGAVYRYPAPVRRALLAEVTACLAPAEIGDLHRLAAHWQTGRGEPRRAVAHALAAEDLGLVSEILLTHGMSLMRQGVGSLLADLPPRAVARHPLIATILGVRARLRGEASAEEYLALVVPAVRYLGRRATLAESAMLATVEGVALRLTGRMPEAAMAARRAIRLLRSGAEPLDALGEQIGDLRVQNAVTLMRAGRPEEARIALADNLAALRELPRAAAVTTVSMEAALRALRGDLDGADEILGMVHERELARHHGATWQVARALRSLDELDAAGARRWCESAVAHPEAVELEPLRVAVAAIADLLGGEPETGLRRLEARRLAAEERHASAQELLLAPVRALLHLGAGRPAEADRALASARHESVLVILLRALHAHLAGDRGTVVGLLARTAGAPPRIAAGAHLLAAASAVQAGHTETAAVDLERLAALMSDTGLGLHLVMLPPSELQALRQLAEVRGLDLVAAALDVDVPAVMPEPTSAVRLTDRERAVLRVLAEHSAHAEIAERLVVSPNTVKSQLRSLYRKLRVSGRAEALAAAEAQGLLSSAA